MAKKMRITERIREVMTDAGKTNFPVADACRLAGITLEQFAENEELQLVYRMAQIETQMALRKAVLADAMNGNSQSIKLYLDKFDAPILPSLDDMPAEDE